MKQSIKLRPVLWDGLVAAAVLLAALLSGLLFWRGGGEQGKTALLSIEDAPAERVELGELKAPKELVVSSRGVTLVIEFSPDGVRVKDADCPGRDCVHSGKISRAGQCIVCLPARVTLRLVGGAEEDAVDAVIG